MCHRHTPFRLSVLQLPGRLRRRPKYYPMKLCVPSQKSDAMAITRSSWRIGPLEYDADVPPPCLHAVTGTTQVGVSDEEKYMAPFCC